MNKGIKIKPWKMIIKIIIKRSPNLLPVDCKLVPVFSADYIKKKDIYDQLLVSIRIKLNQTNWLGNI